MTAQAKHHFQPKKSALTFAFSLLTAGLFQIAPAYAEETDTEATESNKPTFNIGGAVRVNYGIEDYNQASKDRHGDLDLELLRLDIDGSYEDWYLDARYSFYRGQDFDTVNFAFIGFNVDPNNQVEVGIIPVPFGAEPYIGNSFWFSGAYYLGFEDDSDAGIKWKHKGDDYTFDLAYFHQSEYA